ncbi:MAG: enoyl-CoA hydratase/isomerase family protein [Acidimicrobiales bacterium]
MELHEYKDRFKSAEVSRDDHGVLTVRLHGRDGALMWGMRPHRELPELWAMINSDRENRVVVLTGTGDWFIGLQGGGEGLARGQISPFGWDQVIFEGIRLVMQMLDIEIPMICAVNGPAIAHSELAVLCDVVLAAEGAYFQDAPHFPDDLVPGDSMQIIWPLLLGPNRGRYFLLTGQKIDAQEAKQLGIVGEVLPADKLLDRAYEIAHELAHRNPVVLRNTRYVLTRQLKKAMMDDLHMGLALEAVGSLAGKGFYARKDEEAGAS